MSTRSLNKVLLIGNLTRDPELRYTPQGTAVCTFGMATNRTWVTDGGDKKEETEFHRIVAWNKLAELCSQLLFKGRRIYVEGRLQTRQWTAPDGAARVATEIVIEDMILLDSKRQGEDGGSASFEEQHVDAGVGLASEPVSTTAVNSTVDDIQPMATPVVKKKVDGSKTTEEIADDIPF